MLSLDFAVSVVQQRSPKSVAWPIEVRSFVICAAWFCSDKLYK